MTTETPAPDAAALIALIETVCTPIGVESVPLADALGRVLREPVSAPEDQPEFDRSAVDGYAVRFDDPSTVFRIVDEIRAGDWKPRMLSKGESVRIATGGASPSANLQIVMKEDAQAADGTLRVLRRTTESNLRIQGEDAVKGQFLVPAPGRLSAGALALLASLGCTSPCVSRLPRVVHIATGNELVPPEAIPQRGQIRDSNSTLVRAFLQTQGLVPHQFRVAEDELAIMDAVRTNAATADLLLLSGGASVGQHDFTCRALEKNDFEILVRKTATRPGKPLIFARRGHVVAFGLPGNPLAHFVCLNLFVRTALEKIAGLKTAPLWRRGVLTSGLEAGGIARETFWPACSSDQAGQATLTPLRWSSSGDLTSLATANALIRVEGAATSLARGTPVEFVTT